jgi:hypothetical protein
MPFQSNFNSNSCVVCKNHGKFNPVGHKPGPNCPTIQGFECGYCHEYGHTIRHCQHLNSRTSKKTQEPPKPKPVRTTVRVTQAAKQDKIKTANGFHLLPNEDLDAAEPKAAEPKPAERTVRSCESVPIPDNKRTWSQIARQDVVAKPFTVPTVVTKTFTVPTVIACADSPRKVVRDAWADSDDEDYDPSVAALSDPFFN